MRRTFGLLVALGLTAASLVAGPATASAPTVAPSPVSAPSPASPGSKVTALPAQIDYVALGDSYSAGPLIPAQRVDPLGCLRSTNNYPAYLAGYLAVTTYRDVTCSGAEVKDFLSPQETIVPGPSPRPQLQALSTDTDLVTIGIGGNDYSLFGSMIDTCAKVRAQDPNGKPCKKHFTNAKGTDTKLRDAKRIRKHVSQAVRKTAKAAPNAAIFVVGYPRLLPTKGTCAAVPFATGDYAWGNHVERLLNRSIKRAARKHGATYVNLYPVSKGHDACAGKDAWINGSTLDPTRAANFHPFQEGMHQFARAIFTKITGLTPPADLSPNAAPPLGSMILNAG